MGHVGGCFCFVFCGDFGLGFGLGLVGLALPLLRGFELEDFSAFNGEEGGSGGSGDDWRGGGITVGFFLDGHSTS